MMETEVAIILDVEHPLPNKEIQISNSLEAIGEDLGDNDVQVVNSSNISNLNLVDINQEEAGEDKELTMVDDPTSVDELELLNGKSIEEILSYSWN
ncbi:hypothetical protein ACH5RR_006710 [Cinchona calisaya]|uniref:Uncharacterized protein n=1 Tax=Cinchona calisaya TaxID=153742 RepID=A0ABD3APQ6_9GENT